MNYTQMRQSIKDQLYRGSCQTDEVDTFDVANRRRCESYVRAMQRRLDRAVANGNVAKTRWYFHLLSKRSRAVKVLAVHRVTAVNKGKKTPGVDKVALPEGKRTQQNAFRKRLLEEINIERRPLPIRRVFIPKTNGKRRPLGIPTLKDRIVQDILRQAIEPIVEFHFNDKSYGFRPKRCCQDAMKDLFDKMSRHNSKSRWVVEGDIKGCFDAISHDHIINTLLAWNVPIWATDLVRTMLKARIFHNGEVLDSETGTPQGGIISPLLCNVALTTLDEYCNRIRTTNPITRYADDFVIVCRSEREAQTIKDKVARHLKEVVGLTLSEEKTAITHISKGFDFLGFNFRKYKAEPRGKDCKWKLLIKPSKDKVSNLLYNCKKVLKQNRTAKTTNLIKQLNPKLRGWCNYYRHVVSKVTFSTIEWHMFRKVWRWAKRRHNNKSNGWVMNRYFTRKRARRHIFWDRETGVTLYLAGRTPVKRFTKVDSRYRVHQEDKEAKEYWSRREYINASQAIYGNEVWTRKFRWQKGKCGYCHKPITQRNIDEHQIHLHHVISRSHRGDNKLRNLQLLHNECHTERHRLKPLIDSESRVR